MESVIPLIYKKINYIYSVQDQSYTVGFHCSWFCLPGNYISQNIFTNEIANLCVFDIGNLEKVTNNFILLILTIFMDMIRFYDEVVLYTKNVYFSPVVKHFKFHAI